MGAVIIDRGCIANASSDYAIGGAAFKNHSNNRGARIRTAVHMKYLRIFTGYVRGV
jgi:hypothetical protein